MRGHVTGRNLAAALGLTLIAHADPALASPQSEQLITDGVAKLQANQHKAALEAFNRAMAADPKDGRAAFFQGYVLNRLAQFGPAYAAFEDMRKLGANHPEAGYEEGWAAVATGRWQRAIALLEPYEKANPQNGKASEFLGRAYMAVRRFDDAEAALNRAMDRDPATKANALYFLAQVAALRGDTAKEMAQVDRLVREAPASPVGVALGNAARREVAQQAEAKPWTLFAAPAFGYNDNVLSLSGDIVQPTEITNQDSWFFQLDAGGEYRFNILPVSTLTAGYAIRYNAYFDLANQDLVDHNPYLTYRHAVLRDVTAVLTLSGDYMEVGGSFYRDGIVVRPSVVVQTPVPNLAAELFYSFGDFDYKAPTSAGALGAPPQNFDRDSTTHSLGLRGIYEIPEIATTLDGGLARIWNSAKGGDFDYRAFQVTVGGTARLPWWQLTGSAHGALTTYQYDNLNSLAPTTPTGPVGFGFARADTAASFSARLSRPVWGPASVFLQYDYSQEISNISVYQFQQQQVMSGLLARF